MERGDQALAWWRGRGGWRRVAASVAVRVDLPGLVQQVMHEVDVGGMLRSRTVDRVLERRDERQTDAGLANSPSSEEAR